MKQHISVIENLGKLIHLAFKWLFICVIFSVVYLMYNYSYGETALVKETVITASDFVFDTYDNPPKLEPCGYPDKSQVDGQVNLNSLIMGPGVEGALSAVIWFYSPDSYDIPLYTERLVWEMDITPKTPVLPGDECNSLGTFITQTISFYNDEPFFEASISEISQAANFPVQIEQGATRIITGNEDPYEAFTQEPFITSHGNWACGKLSIYPKIVDDPITGCTDTINHPQEKASPFDDWNSEEPTETHRFKLEVDYSDWVVRAYIDDMDNPLGETGIYSSSPYRVNFQLPARTAPNRAFHRIYSNIDIYTLTPKIDCLAVTPNVLFAGQTADVTITVSGLDVIQCSDLDVTFSAGVTVNSVTATNATTIVANVTVADRINSIAPCIATLVACSQTATCGQSITLVCPVSLTVTPRSVRSGFIFGRLQRITIQGINANFDDSTEVEIEDAYVLGVNAVSDTELNVWIWVPSRMRIETGEKKVSVKTGGHWLCTTGSLTLQ
jgi:hypothetical protein